MTTAIGRGVRLEVALTYASAKNVTAVTLASPGVATSTSHGLANGTVGYWAVAAGMVQLDGQATRVYNQSTNAFDLQGLNTAGYSTFSGTQTFTPVATWGTLSETIGYQIGGGSADKLDDTKISDVIKQEIIGTLPADTVQIDLLSQTYNSSTMQLIEDASIQQTYLVFRITQQDSSVRVWRGIPSRPGESLQRQALATGSFEVSCKGFVLRGAA
jgi:hypothetical protein